MPMGAVIAGGAGLIGSIAGSRAQAKAADRASQAQENAAMAGIDETRRQFDALQELMKPFVNAGTGALSGQQDLLGLNGAEKQQAAINNIANSAEFQTYLDQGENSLRQNASATGGLRGGNMQAALAQFSPNLLNQMINQRFTNLGGLTALGQNAAAGVGNAGMQTAGNISNLLQQSGAAQAGGYLAKGQNTANMYSGLSGAIGNIAGMYLGKGGF